MLRKWGTAFVAGALLVSSSVAAIAGTDALQQPQAQQGALMPGGPAGVQQAALHAPLWVWIAGIGFVALGVGLVASSTSKKAASTTTTVKP